jgi:ribosomal protein L11 methyltransferase
MGDPGPSAWLELTVRIAPEDVDPISAALIEHGSVGTWEPEPGLLVAYFPQSTSPEQLKVQLERYGDSTRWGRMTLVELKSVPAQDWNATWKATLVPLVITPRLVVAPSWSEHQPQPGQRVVRLDPGMAFGTGHHETTRVCLQLLDERLSEGSSLTVLDLGTGSGILAIAAARLGAAWVVACDTDPEACEIAQANVRANGVSDRVVVVDPEAGWARGPYDLIVANLTAPVLVEEMPRIAAGLKPGDGAILGGILVDQEPLVAQAADRARLSLSERERDGEWVALVVRAP